MNDLRGIWEIGGFVEDQNHDGVADQVNLSIKLDKHQVIPGLIDFCARLGFETTSLSFDFFRENSRYANKLEFVQNDEQTAIECVSPNEIIIFYKDIESMSELLRFLAGKWHKDFTPNEGPVSKISLDDDAVVIHGEKWPLDKKPGHTDIHYKVHSLSDVWHDVGFLHGPEPSPHNKQAVTIHAADGLSELGWTEICYGAARIGMESTELAFPMTGNLSTHPFALHFEANEKEEATVALMDNEIHFTGKNDALENAISYFFREKHWRFQGHFGSWERQFHAMANEDEELFHFTWQDEGERAELDELMDQLDGKVNKTEPIRMTVYLSDAKEIRDEVAAKIRDKFPESDVQVRSAFKPGYFWVTEEILPRLTALDAEVDAVTIYCLKEEREDGLELPIRWIQEMYPIDEMIAQKLNIDVSSIQFELTEELDATYRLSAYGRNGETLTEDAISIPVSKVPYVEENKYSYPTTSHLFAEQHGEVLVDAIIQTDRERFYLYYMEEILPKLWEKADVSDELSGTLKPLFDRIEIVAGLSEEEMKIPVAEERISSLEALHEDVYFNTLDYFHIKGEETADKPYITPGGVYPFMKVTPGEKPSAEITAYAWSERERPSVATTKLGFQFGHRHPLWAECLVDETPQRIALDTHKENGFVPLPDDLPKPKSAEFRPWLADYSYRGRPIFVYELFHDIKEDYYSAIKLSVHKPTVLIETGHHANEVSSTPGVMEMLDSLDKEHPDLLKHLNLVVIPRANPDGTALQQRMAEDNPEWKLHAARYNAVGLEFSHVRYKDSVFGEANVLPKIMDRWAPDILIDNHGIPSHEWTQPFAGYHIPPRFNMSFWIPSAMLYGIARQLDKEKYPQHTEILNQITQSIQAKVSGTKIHELNQYWLDRYKKYGHQFMPELFPIELVEEFIFYHWNTKVHPDSVNGIERFPEWVSAELISEAADETVYGETLEICKDGQQLFDLGAVDWINKDVQAIQKAYGENNVSISRVRPLNIKE
ncbi:M14 family metallopeptidase [Virgibacillus sp. YIM 98842]|uniref:M14 family metallopeptidase n=1 Tax=Virgibacillus sp. YIM 98842 TaxID=2663533 RepID=UPI0013DB196E|nr:M14 family metallopeptidase [Virgibacillus sp. YIM 98842]